MTYRSFYSTALHKYKNSQCQVLGSWAGSPTPHRIEKSHVSHLVHRKVLCTPGSWYKEPTEDILCPLFDAKNHWWHPAPTQSPTTRKPPNFYLSQQNPPPMSKLPYKTHSPSSLRANSHFVLGLTSPDLQESYCYLLQPRLSQWSQLCFTLPNTNSTQLYLLQNWSCSKRKRCSFLYF